METKNFTENNFYKEELEKCNFGEILKVKKNKIIKNENSEADPVKGEIIFDKGTENLLFKPGRCSLEELVSNDVLSYFLDYLNSGCSYLRAYTYLKKINSFSEKNPGAVSDLKEKLKKDGAELKSYFFWNVIKSYTEKLSENQKNREFDVGDKVKIRNKKIENAKKCFDYYSKERDRIFPRGSIGIIIKINNFGSPMVYFNNKTDYKPNFEKLINKKTIKEGLKEYIGEWIEDCDYRKNIGYYSHEELNFVPINEFEISKINHEATKLDKLFGL